MIHDIVSVVLRYFHTFLSCRHTRSPPANETNWIDSLLDLKLVSMEVEVEVYIFKIAQESKI